MYKQRLIMLAAAAAFLTGTVLLTAGCSDKPSCKLLYKRLDKCEDDFPLKEDKFIKFCKKRKDKPGFKEQIACSKESDCDKFKKCVKGAEKKARFARIEKRIDEALAKKKYRRALSTCKWRKKDLNEGLKKKCAEVAKGAYKELSAKAIKMRDTGPVKDEYMLCSDLKAAGEAMGDKKKAEALCEQVKLAKRSRQAIKKAGESAKKSTIIVPYYCTMALKDLDKSKLAFAKKLKAKVLKACYIDLGIVVLGKAEPKLKRYCPYTAKKIYKAVKKYNLKDPKLDPLMEKAAEKCGK